MDTVAPRSATVRDVAFSGRGYDHVIELTSGNRLTGVFAASRYERGQRVGVHLDARGCLVFPEQGANAASRTPSPAEQLSTT